MKDFNKNDLKIGDVVAFLEANYRDLKKEQSSTSLKK